MLRIIRKSVKWILDNMPGGNYIVFESVPDLSDNTKAVFDEMQRRNLQKKYRMFWWVKDRKADLPKFPNTAYLDMNTRWNRIVFRWINIRAKCVISCNQFLLAPLPSRVAIYLTHGTALKKLNDYYVPEEMSYILIASEHLREPMSREFRVPAEKMSALGFPRNDVLHMANRDLHDLFPGDFRKVIVWYPTFRQHKGGLKTGAVNALPLLYDAQAAIALDRLAKKLGILIVVKPHFAQDLSYITQYALSNIRFIDDSFFYKHNISSYEFVGSCDALITDYSSIYFDYLLCDKPVAVIWEDIEDYRKNPGFALDPNFYMKAAQKIYTLSEFETFICDLATGRDPYRQERQEINALVNYAADGKNTQRVVDFIIEKAKL